jgi:hypothetical protein
MKRTSEHLDNGGRQQFAPIDSSTSRASQPPVTARASNAAGAAAVSQPQLRSTTARIGIPVMPAALGPLQPQPVLVAQHFVYPPPLQPADPKVHHHHQQPLIDQIRASINRGVGSWMKTAISLKDQERTNFMIASLHEVIRSYRLSSSWFGPVNMIMGSVGMDRLLAHRWPGDAGLVSILVRLMPNRWLDQALAHDAGRMSLREANVVGWTPLDHAVAASSTKAVRQILPFDDEMGTLRLHQSQAKRIALHIACLTNNAKVVDLLLERNGKAQRLSFCDGQCMPVHFAAGIGADARILQRLLAEHATEQTLAKTLVLNRNALMFAVAAKAPSLVRQLLAVETTLADQLEARDCNGQRAVDYARDAGDADIIRAIADATQWLSLTSSSAATGMVPGRTAQPRDNESTASTTPSPASPEIKENPHVSEAKPGLDAQ